MAWKLLSIVNSLFILVMGYFVLVEFSDVAGRVSVLESENIELIATTKEMQVELEELLSTVDYLSGRVNKLELSEAVSDMSKSAEYGNQDVSSSNLVSYGSPQQLPEANFSHDMGDCSGVGKGFIGLFADIFSKCPSDVTGFAIKLSR